MVLSSAEELVRLNTVKLLQETLAVYPLDSSFICVALWYAADRLHFREINYPFDVHNEVIKVLQEVCDENWEYSSKKLGDVASFTGDANRRKLLEHALRCYRDNIPLGKWEDIK